MAFEWSSNNKEIEELNNYLIDQSELTTLIMGGDWNCTLTKKDKKGGLPWQQQQRIFLIW